MIAFIAGYAFAIVEAAFVLYVLRRRGFVSWGAEGSNPDRYQEGYQEGYSDGHKAGFDSGAGR